MPFPYWIRGSVPLAGDAENHVEGVIESCVAQLEREGARITSHDATTFSVRVGRLWSGDWSLTTTLNGGTLKIGPGSDGQQALKYDLLVGRVVIIAMFAVPVALSLMPRAQIGPLVLVLLAVITANYALTANRARRWCRKRIAESVSSSVSEGSWAQR